MRRFWVKESFIEPRHPGNNPFEKDQANWKAKITKIIIDYNVNYCGWSRVMQHTADLHNNRANQANEDNLPPLTLAKGDVVGITLLNEFHFNA